MCPAAIARLPSLAEGSKSWLAWPLAAGKERFRRPGIWET